MNLTPQELIDSLLRSAQPVRRPRTAMHTPNSTARCRQPLPMASRASRGCRCGVCAKCVEDRRWEEIFERKFADPEYYSPDRTVAHASPLNDIMRG
jgi:hypothetical protein